MTSVKVWMLLHILLLLLLSTNEYRAAPLGESNADEDIGKYLDSTDVEGEIVDEESAVPTLTGARIRCNLTTTLNASSGAGLQSLLSEALLQMNIYPEVRDLVAVTGGTTSTGALLSSAGNIFFTLGQLSPFDSKLLLDILVLLFHLGLFSSSSSSTFFRRRDTATLSPLRWQPRSHHLRPT
ncbi:hypothetical protein Aperf_G00000112393 [Anoplocephala perfoliata]